MPQEAFVHHGQGAFGLPQLHDRFSCGSGETDLLDIAREFEIDVSMFRDLAVSRAVQNASYSALTWLHRECNVNVIKIADGEGNGLLHQIAVSRNASKFFRRVGEVNLEHEYTPEGLVDFIYEVGGKRE